MRGEALLLVTLLLAAGLSGCLGGDDEALDPTGEDPTTLPDDGDGSDTGDDTGDNDDGNDDPPADDGNDGSDGQEVPPTVQDIPQTPQVVVAHIDTGVNPYHKAFRDTSPLAHIPPWRYIDGYPEDVPALRLTLDAPTYEAALEADADMWDDVEDGQLYWIPGTRIIGAISFGAGGTFTADQTEHPILDDHGHGTMTASRAVAATHSLCPSCRLVTIEGLGAGSVQWAADQGWIDVQTNSWGSLVPHPATEAVAPAIADAFADASTKMVTIAASGNGAGFFLGFTPWPTYVTATAPPGVILVGAHDNGYVTAWSGSPPHVVADGFRPWAALRDSLDQMAETPLACCTSTSAPYAAGGAARIIMQARTILEDTTEGLHDGALAKGAPDLVPDGPLKDGELTLDELKQLLFATAQARPIATDHDGDAHWLARPADSGGPEDPTNPGGNPYCEGCWTTFIPYDQIPPDAPLYTFVGYGAINIYSAQAATDVLTGAQPMPERATEDDAYEADQTLRGVLYRDA